MSANSLWFDDPKYFLNVPHLRLEHPKVKKTVPKHEFQKAFYNV